MERKIKVQSNEIHQNRFVIKIFKSVISAQTIESVSNKLTAVSGIFSDCIEVHRNETTI